MGVFTVRASDLDADGRFSKVGVVLEGVEVVSNLESVNQAIVVLYGLIYALNLNYPVSLFNRQELNLVKKYLYYYVYFRYIYIYF